jgi:hypothetical protein
LDALARPLLATSHEVQQFLRRGLVAPTAVAALLRHRAADPARSIRLIGARSIRRIDLRFRELIAPGFVGQGLVADLSAAHDRTPSLKISDNA